MTVELLARADHVVTERVDTALRGSGVTADQWRVMIHLYEARGCTMSDLAEASSLTGSTVSRTVDRLTTSALAHRNVDPTDRRRVLVHLSRRGRTVVRQLLPEVRAAEAGALSGLSDHEQTELRRLLARVTTS